MTKTNAKSPKVFEVVVFTHKILDDFDDLFLECMFSRRKPTTNFGDDRFSQVTISIERETKTHILQTKIKEQIRAPLTIIILLK